MVSNLVVKLIDESKDIIIDNMGAIAGTVGGAIIGAAGGFAVAKIQDDKIIQEEKKKSFKHGVRVGVKLASDEMRQTFIDPVLARVALVYFIARIDGTISKKEKAILQDVVDHIMNNPELPDVLKKEVKKIINDKSIDFDTVSYYLDKVNLNTLNSLMKDVYDIAEANGINEKEEEAIDLLNRYVESRIGDTQLQVTYDNNISSIDEYVDTFVSEEKIQRKSEEYNLRMRMLDYAFTKETGLNKKEIGLLVTSIGLQCLRVYLVNYVTTMEKAGAKNKKETALHKQQEKILSHFNSNEVDKSTKYHAPLNQIITTYGVPYDTTRYANGVNKGLFKGANHRFATLGHDPLIGLIIGTGNIMTNTITIVEDKQPLPLTYHVAYDNLYKNPQISSEASTLQMITKTYERSQKDLKPLVASVIKQLIHIATDLYTPAGIQLPGSNLALSKQNVELLTSYVSAGDILKVQASSTIEVLINELIALIHGCMLLEENEVLEDLHKVKTRKIILYSNLAVTSSNMLKESIFGHYDKLDWGGVLVLVNRMFNDINFIYDVKREFIRRGLGE